MGFTLEDQTNLAQDMSALAGMRSGRMGLGFGGGDDDGASKRVLTYGRFAKSGVITKDDILEKQNENGAVQQKSEPNGQNAQENGDATTKKKKKKKDKKSKKKSKKKKNKDREEKAEMHIECDAEAVKSKKKKKRKRKREESEAETEV